MFYEKFETDNTGCIRVEIFSLASDSRELLFSQLITDGNIDDKNTIISKRQIDDINFNYFKKDDIEEIEQYQKDCTFGIVRELKVEHPSYCMFTVYRYNGKEWVLCGRTIISNKKNGLLYDFKILGYVPYLGELISISKPVKLLSNQKIPNQKILKKRKNYRNW